MCGGVYPMNKNAGFTLIEMLVVVLIIGLLVALALPQYEKAVEKSRATEAFTMLKSIAQANEVYYMSNGKYADIVDELDITIPGTGSKSYNDNGIAIAQRLPMDKGYSLVMFPTDNTIYCKAYSDKGIQICRTVGAVEVSKTYAYYPVKL